MKRYLLILAFMVSPAFAGEDTSVVAKDDTVWVYPRIPLEEEKAAAIRKAYEINGNSMVGWYMIDLSQPPPVAVRTIPIEPAKKRERR